MFTKIISLILFTLFITHTAVIAQDYSNLNELRHYVSDGSINVDEFISSCNKELSENTNVNLDIIKSLKAKSGYIHYKLEQRMEGIRVLGSNYNIHSKEDKVITANGNLHKINKIPSSARYLSNQEMLRSVDGFIKLSQEFISESSEEEPMITKSSIEELVVVDRTYPKISGLYTKAYIIDVSIEFPYDELIFVVDAYTGQVIHMQSIMCGYGVEGTGKTKYYGDQKIVVDSIAPNEFHLKDPGRNITTYTAKSGNIEEYSNESKDWDLDSEDLDEVALDAHYCSSKFYDMMNDLFQYQGIDGVGGALDPVVHANNGRAYLNAFWNGTNAYFGNGDCHHNPLTTLSVVGHEFTHGVTDYTSDLIYADESGGINESMSDIFGKALEYLYDNENFSWQLDPVFAKTIHSSFFRDMSNPNEYNDPAFYKGEFWSESGAVHTNSGVFNYWFYLMLEGINGINEVGFNYDVTAMPLDEILQVVFLCQKAYLTSSSNYSELHLYTIDATKELYGENSPMMSSVVEAWKAVGLPHQTVDTLFDLIVTSEIESNVTCYDDYQYTIDIQVTNIGAESVPAGTEIGVNIKTNDGIDTVVYMTLTNDLLSDEVLDLSLPNAMHVVENRIYFYNLRLILEDDITDNNFEFGYIRNFTRDEPYLDLTDATANIFECFNDEITIGFNIYNQSCGLLPADTEFEIEVANGSVILDTRSYKTTRNINSNAREGFELKLNGITEFEDLQIRITSAALDYDQELTRMDVFEKRTVTGDYYNGFDDLSFFDDFRVLSNPILFDYEDESYLGSFGAVNGLSRVPCPELIDNIELISFGKTSFEACVDMSHSPSPYLDFDLIQFRQEGTDYPSLEQNSTLVHVEYEYNGTIFTDLISEQTEGLIKSHSYRLPSNFKGRLKVIMFNHAGALDQIPSLAYDANLIDNVELSGLTNTEDQSNQHTIKVFPSPSSNYIHIASSTLIDYIEMYSVSGNLMGVYYKSKINIQNFVEGIYLIKVFDNEGNVQVGKFIKS